MYWFDYYFEAGRPTVEDGVVVVDIVDVAIVGSDYDADISNFLLK